MDKVCRVCLSSADLVDIYAEGQLPEGEPSLAEMLNACVKNQVKPTDKLTKMICKSCIVDVRVAFRLRRKSEESHKKLINTCLNENDMEDFIDMLEAEDWELVKDSIKQELEESSELDSQAESLPESQSTAESNMPSRRKKPYVCKICGKAFRANANLTIHHRSHTGERPFKCPKCNKCFTQLSALKPHQIVHTRERSFKCCHCPKDFTSKYNLLKHISNNHSPKEPQINADNKKRDDRLKARHATTNKKDPAAEADTANK
ncbi:uncharacterized protein Dvir_GJ12300 [Drosophila virilis]|uniref:Uncharacterized protein n=1 Tax=Drosophila virilis TaxID=7244 RepID=B4LEN5_DROVI|nr:uncharacterized protein Dvir_GJ12300 [Drosophila virilis]